MAEKHQFQFRGVWLPAEILELTSQGKLTPREVLLLTIIDALVGRERGCYASNGYLARQVGTTPRQVKRMINKLDEMGLVARRLEDGYRREIVTAWSRPRVLEGGDTHDTPGGRGCHGGRGMDAPLYRRDITNCSTNPVCATDGEGDVFFEKYAKPKAHEPIDETNAQHLIATVRTKLPGKRVQAPSWAKQFALLRKSVDEERIRQVLNWYQDNIGGQYVPQAYSAKSFREKFLQIEKAMERDPEYEGEISDQARALADQIAQAYDWPKGSARQLARCIDRDIEFYKEFLEDLKDTINHLTYTDLPKGGVKLRKVRRFAQWLRRDLPPVRMFVLDWYKQTNQRVIGWDNWSGELQPLSIHKDIKRFNKMGRQAATTWGGDPKRWDKLMEVMCEGTN